MRIPTLPESFWVTATMLAVVAQAGAQAAPPRAQPPGPGVNASQDAPPPDATGRCRDGSFTTEALVASACADRGGAMVVFPGRQTVPSRPAPASLPSLQPLSLPQASAIRPVDAPSVIARPEVVKPATSELGVPAGARARCRDGTYITSGEPASACEGRSGVAVIFPAISPPPVRLEPSVTPVDRRSHTVIPARPSGATAQCNDGSYVVGPPDPSRCSANGGISAVFPVDPAPPALKEPSQPSRNGLKATTPPKRSQETIAIP